MITTRRWRWQRRWETTRTPSVKRPLSPSHWLGSACLCSSPRNNSCVCAPTRREMRERRRSPAAVGEEKERKRRTENTLVERDASENKTTSCPCDSTRMCTDDFFFRRFCLFSERYFSRKACARVLEGRHNLKSWQVRTSLAGLRVHSKL